MDSVIRSSIIGGLPLISFPASRQLKLLGRRIWFCHFWFPPTSTPTPFVNYALKYSYDPSSWAIKYFLSTLNPSTPTSDQDRISLYNINTISSRQVMRIKKDISYGIKSWSNTKFCKPTSQELYGRQWGELIMRLGSWRVNTLLVMSDPCLIPPENHVTPSKLLLTLWDQ